MRGKGYQLAAGVRNSAGKRVVSARDHAPTVSAGRSMSRSVRPWLVVWVMWQRWAAGIARVIVVGVQAVGVDRRRPSMIPVFAITGLLPMFSVRRPARNLIFGNRSVRRVIICGRRSTMIMAAVSGRARRLAARTRCGV